MIENERSFLVAKIPPFDDTKIKNIEQHYLTEGKEPLRLRRADRTFELTKKLTIDPTDPSRKDELTIPLSEEQYNRLVTLSVRSLTKRRHLIPLVNGLTAELDVFLGPLEGFVKVEVEFPNEDARSAFTPPEWFGKDISQEKWSSNSWLAGKSFADVRQYL